MDETRVLEQRGLTILRWIARVWSIVSIGFVLAIFIGSGFEEGFTLAQFAPPELVGLVFFPCGVCLGMILAWRWEGIGGGITIGSLLVFYTVLTLIGGRFPRGPWFALVAAPGILFLACWLLARGKGRAALG